ncbi:MAG: oxygen-dependent coproporphyrinogen oxidase [Candidatus Thermochlorobacter sp.]
MSLFKDRVQTYLESLQQHITSVLEALDGKGKFVEETWQHQTGGGGKTRIIQDGAIFEKGGVNFSAVSGVLPEKMAAKMNTEVTPYFATGVSVVIHPYSPMIPTVHCNYRYFEQYDADGNVKRAWFGGGADLTPYYPFLEDIQHFHRVHKEACDKHNPEFYPKFKAWCDEYFFIAHRNETRGVGGIFFDYLSDNLEATFDFVKSCGDAFTEAYAPIVERRRHEPFGEQEKRFQRLRRGRYVEFNLVYDRGTLFGLETRGRTESILMSLPKEVAWEYNYTPQPDSREALLYRCLKARDWLNETAL